MRSMEKKAQSLIEYGLILALVAVVAVTILGKFGKTMTDTADKTNTAVSKASDNASANYCTQIGSTYDATSGLCK